MVLCQQLMQRHLQILQARRTKFDLSPILTLREQNCVSYSQRSSVRAHIALTFNCTFIKAPLFKTMLYTLYSVSHKS